MVIPVHLCGSIEYQDLMLVQAGHTVGRGGQLEAAYLREETGLSCVQAGHDGETTLQLPIPAAKITEHLVLHLSKSDGVTLLQRGKSGQLVYRWLVWKLEHRALSELLEWPLHQEAQFLLQAAHMAVAYLPPGGQRLQPGGQAIDVRLIEREQLEQLRLLVKDDQASVYLASIGQGAQQQLVQCAGLAQPTESGLGGPQQICKITLLLLEKQRTLIGVRTGLSRAVQYVLDLGIAAQSPSFA